MPDPASRLPSRPSLEQLRKQAKERLAALRVADPSAQLADAQFALAREYGFESWPKLVSHVEATIRASKEPTLTAPVSRRLGTRDLGRAVAFWRDVLGFELRHQDEKSGSAELVCGKASIRFGASDWEPYLDESRSPGSAVIFFETDDVDGLRDTIAARGGQPTALVRVNWLKARMFQVWDHDGHTLWFGELDPADGPERPRAMMQTIMPELPLNDVAAGLRHYRDVLGFTVNYEQHDIAVMDRDEVRLLLIARTPRHTGIGSASLYVRDADMVHAELLRNGADVQGEPISQPWGLREFSILDPEGNRLTFGKPFE